ncbi:hypothetical protein [Nocardioides coralli]|uniref:hypothetical protein n=1 Tax=Nocardioides coralli TaxID=2872154 RepID=UPI001CA40DDD|nr:hypothetical protein [Nocardioides coralli]QZY29830.1 hypothetical protein K6T13_03845 [Nocardioides coralli]
MSRPLRRAAVLSTLVACFVAPATISYALWSVTATGTVGVSTGGVIGGSATYYLSNPGTGNTASSTHLDLVTTAPTLGSLPNYDTDRDAFPGRLLQKGNGLSETDPTKHQLWSVSGPVAAVNAPVKLRLWSAMKDFDTTKKSSVVAGLYQCNDNPNFTGCNLLAQATVAPSGAWSGGSGGWVAKEWSFGTLTLAVPHNRRLYVKVAVNNASDDDVWFAYDTAAQPSALEIG